MTTLPLKTFARTLHAWQHRLAYAITGFVLFSVSVWGYTIAKISEQHAEQVLFTLSHTADNTEQQSIVSLLAKHNGIIDIYYPNTGINIPIRPNVWLNWTRLSSKHQLSNGQAVQIRYLVLSGRHIILLTSALCSFWLIAMLAVWFAGHKTEQRVFSLERKARRLYQGRRPESHPKNETIFDILENLLDELTQARQEQNKVDKFIRVQTFLDPQTGIGNRVFFENRLEALLNIEEQVEQGSVIGIRLNDFERLEEKDATAAQELIGQFSQIVGQSLKRFPDAIFARYSRHDFAVLLTNVPLRDLEQLCKHLLRSLSHIRVPAPLDPDSFYHIGVATFKSGDQLTQVLLEADMALRSAQLQGSSNWFMYQETDRAKTMTMGSLQWRTLIEKTLMQQGLILYFQSVMQTQPRQTHHQEVLVRMRDNDGKILKAGLFMPMAHKCGLVKQIDKQVISKLFRLFEQDNNSQVACSVNLSADSITDKEFKAWFLAKLAEQPEHAKRLIIEITEHILVSHSDELSLFLQQLDKINVRILVDQVGQYVISSDYIKAHPVSYLKLHASIVRNIQSKSENQLFIRSLQGTCASTSIKIFAFGLETEAEWQTLKRLNVSGAQGEFFNPPEANLLMPDNHH
ncbi:EAL domain-containing protein [Catenovulum sediminis]|uniref:EAL domain-containing protein n=1 Tax=Catenovulum sediminis TaxID=1740262 RepID=A0ABV1RCH2_9ALTE|nr:EAL domain-containing protein [Catenovulum sediminis]